MYVNGTPIFSKANRTHPSFCVSSHECINAIRGRDMARVAAVTRLPVSLPSRTLAITASRTTAQTYTTKKVPAGYRDPSTVNEAVATASIDELAFWGQS